MIKQKQLIKHDPENGKFGDCGRAVIACLLEMPVENVPHFYDNNQKTGNHDLEVWLKKRGISLLTFPLSGETVYDALEWASSYLKEHEYMLMGTSRNNVNHVVICRDAEIIHDPSIDNSGIIGPADDGYFWIEFLFKDIGATK